MRARNAGTPQPAPWPTTVRSKSGDLTFMRRSDFYCAAFQASPHPRSGPGSPVATRAPTRISSIFRKHQRRPPRRSLTVEQYKDDRKVCRPGGNPYTAPALASKRQHGGPP
jgi:hypothetical protein